MTTQTNNKPVDTIRFGGLKAVIWRNQPKTDDQKVRYTVNYIRSYKNSDGDGKIQTRLARSITSSLVVSVHDRRSDNGVD